MKIKIITKGDSQHCSIEEYEDADGLMSIKGYIDQAKRDDQWITTPEVELSCGDLCITYYGQSFEPDHIKTAADMLALLETMFDQLAEVSALAAKLKTSLHESGEE